MKDRESVLLSHVMQVLTEVTDLQRRVQHDRSALGGLVRFLYDEYSDKERANAVKNIPLVKADTERWWKKLAHAKR